MTPLTLNQQLLTTLLRQYQSVFSIQVVEQTQLARQQSRLESREGKSRAGNKKIIAALKKRTEKRSMLLKEIDQEIARRYYQAFAIAELGYYGYKKYNEKSHEKAPYL